MLEEKISTEFNAAATITTYTARRIYPAIMPQNPTYPAVTFLRVSNNHIYSLSGPSSLENPRMQIDCWSTSYEQVKKLARGVFNTMTASTRFKAVMENESDLYEPEVEVYRISQDYSCWNYTT